MSYEDVDDPGTRHPLEPGVLETRLNEAYPKLAGSILTAFYGSGGYGKWDDPTTLQAMADAANGA